MASADDIAALLLQPAAKEPGMGSLAQAWGSVGGAMPESYGRKEEILDPVAKAVVGMGSLATLPKRAMEASEAMRRGEGYDPAPAVETALSTAGMGGIAGVPMRAGEMALGSGAVRESPVQKVIRAYHGSPHDFDKFSLNKVGAGEGAQAYGHGLYFAESEPVAKFYRDSLSRADDGRYLDIESAQKNLDYLRESLKDPSFAANIAPEEAAAHLAHAEEAVAQAKSRVPGGKMYEVNINADPEHFLDWDKPLHEQPAIAQKLGWTPEEIAAHKAAQAQSDDSLLAALEGRAVYETPKLPPTNGRPPLTATGADIAKGNSIFDSAADAGRAGTLRSAGIPGIKYLDQGSRTAGEGSRNYVVFDDNLINIARKYGMGSLAALPPATLAALSQQEPQP